MEELELKELWKASTEKWEQTIILSRQNTEDITKIKVQYFISSMKPIKIFTLLVGIGWVGLGSIILANLFLHGYTETSKFFLFSASIQVLLTAAALVIYIYQLILIYQVDISEPILATQDKLTGLKSSTLLVTRLLFLQLPCWTTFYWSESMFDDGNMLLLFTQVLVTLLFTWASIWLFLNIKYENRNKKWFRLVFEGKEWGPVLQSMELLKQLEDYKEVKDDLS